MARGWPALTAFYLETWRVQKSCATSSVLEFFAELCPRLQDLELPLDLSTLPPNPRVSTHRLYNLAGRGFICEAGVKTVAKYLDVLFPRLKYMERNESWPTVKIWKELDVARKEYQAAREDSERSRFLANLAMGVVH
ncbi:hypothetical protein Hypma_001959 [Hypsizygus marmoreus]|uniref:Uncharacterized protein n=1 Tax=Hypsizygus marmoreus TaxID=39966 RepID=A0A369J9H4_HYPMA|nr:hypothetical protein Hypma_001959 [Hypsizygus marmoreus]